VSSIIEQHMADCPSAPKASPRAASIARRPRAAEPASTDHTGDAVPIPGPIFVLTPSEIEAMKRARDHIFNMEPGDPRGANYPDHDGADVCWYVNDEGGIDPDDDPAVSAEHLGSETVFGLEHPCWRVTTRSGKTFWVIDEPARSCYDGDTFDHMTMAMYQHIGVMVRMAESMGRPCPYH
jgi:hypothetical protein